MQPILSLHTCRFRGDPSCHACGYAEGHRKYCEAKQLGQSFVLSAVDTEQITAQDAKNLSADLVFLLGMAVQFGEARATNALMPPAATAASTESRFEFVEFEDLVAVEVTAKGMRKRKLNANDND